VDSVSPHPKKINKRENRIQKIEMNRLTFWNKNILKEKKRASKMRTTVRVASLESCAPLLLVAQGLAI
jgi:hypothetical protein